VVLYLAWRMVVSDIEKYVSKMLAKMIAIFGSARKWLLIFKSNYGEWAYYRLGCFQNGKIRAWISILGVGCLSALFLLGWPL